MKKATVGDKVKALGFVVTIGKILYQDYWEEDGWDIEFIDSEIAAINKKAEKAKIRAEITKAEGDEMRAVVESALTNDWQSIASILNAIGDEEFTKGKVSARLGALIKMGIAEKESQTVDGKRVMHYRLIND